MTASGGLVARLLAPFQGRQDSELEQALIRIVLGLLLVGYLVFAVLSDGAVDVTERALLVAAGLFIAGAFGIISWIAWDPLPCPRRRIAGMLVDFGATSAGLYFGGEAATPLYGVYLWVVVGNGFRYGTRYLYLATALSVTGFVSAKSLSTLSSPPRSSILPTSLSDITSPRGRPSTVPARAPTSRYPLTGPSTTLYVPGKTPSNL